MLHGDVIAQHYHQVWTKGCKYPFIRFPSGLERELIASGREPFPSVHIFGAISLPYRATRDEAYAIALPIAQTYDCQALKQGYDNLTLLNAATDRSYHLIYDNRQRILTDIRHFPKWAMELLPGEQRAALPPLYANEKVGLNAIAPIKFFTPDSGWAWYPTEYDGKDLFFGLVAGLEVELGYFSLADLEAVRGPLGLTIERDLYFKPATLKELQDRHI